MSQHLITLIMVTKQISLYQITAYMAMDCDSKNFQHKTDNYIFSYILEPLVSNFHQDTTHDTTTVMLLLFHNPPSSYSFKPVLITIYCLMEFCALL